MVDDFAGFQPGDRVTVYRPYDTLDDEPSGEAEFARVSPEDPEYAWVVERDDDAPTSRRYTVHTSDVGANLTQTPRAE